MAHCTARRRSRRQRKPNTGISRQATTALPGGTIVLAGQPVAPRPDTPGKRHRKRDRLRQPVPSVLPGDVRFRVDFHACLEQSSHKARCRPATSPFGGRIRHSTNTPARSRAGGAPRLGQFQTVVACDHLRKAGKQATPLKPPAVPRQRAATTVLKPVQPSFKPTLHPAISPAGRAAKAASSSGTPPRPASAMPTRRHGHRTVDPGEAPYAAGTQPLAASAGNRTRDVIAQAAHGQQIASRTERVEMTLLDHIRPYCRAVGRKHTATRIRKHTP